jgi:hypothetical protein
VQHAPTKSWRTADYRESVIVTLVNGHPHTSFGHRLHRRGIEQTLDGIADRLVQEIALMHQVTLIDKRFGKHTDLWEGLQKL